MKIIGKKLSLEQFKEYIKNKDFGSIPPSSLVIHHTWSPTEKQWDGNKSIKGLKRFYEGKGWLAGPHLFVADDGIWLFTDMYDVGIHAGTGNATWINKKTSTKWKGWGDDFKNHTLKNYSIGIEVVGNYDKKVWSGETYKNSIEAIKALMNTLNLRKEDIYFHREFSNKSCPGNAITKEWLFEKLKKENNYCNNCKKLNTQVNKQFEQIVELKKDLKEREKEIEKLKRNALEVLSVKETILALLGKLK